MKGRVLRRDPHQLNTYYHLCKVYIVLEEQRCNFTDVVSTPHVYDITYDTVCFAKSESIFTSILINTGFWKCRKKKRGLKQHDNVLKTFHLLNIFILDKINH